MPKTVPLSKKLKTHEGEIDKLEFRDLTAADVVECRTSPIKITTTKGEQVAEYRYDVVMMLASRLTGIDDLILGGMPIKDFHLVTNAVVDIWNASGE